MVRILDFFYRLRTTFYELKPTMSDFKTFQTKIGYEERHKM